jgi:hypothetical protein
MRWIVLAASTLAAALLWLPGQAAQPDAIAAEAKTAEAKPVDAKPVADTISFEQYRDWRNRFIEERQTQLAARLAATNLTAAQRGRIEQQKGYYDWFAGLSAGERDRRFRERFDQIDANHDGSIDAGERAAWHEKQRAFYDRGYDRGRNRQQASVREPQ